MYVDIELAKRHLNVETEFTDDDSYISQLIDVAEAVVSKDLCKELKELEDENHEIPSPIKQCILLMIGHAYENREPVAFVQAYEVPLAYRHIIDLYKEPQL